MTGAASSSSDLCAQEGDRATRESEFNSGEALRICRRSSSVGETPWD